MGTPVLTQHARQRCVEMGIPTKRVKALVRNPVMDYCSRDGRIATSPHEDFAAVYKIENGQRIVVTVVPRTQDDYVRPGDSAARSG